MANRAQMGAPHRIFLIKVNQEAAPLNQNGTSVDTAEWEGGTFLTGPPRKRVTWRNLAVPPRGIADPCDGDRLYIWINGLGLSATAEVANLSREVLAVPCPHRGRRIQVMDVRSFEPIGVINDSNIRGLPGTVFEDIHRSRLVTLRYLSGEDAQELDDAVLRITISTMTACGPTMAPA